MKEETKPPGVRVAFVCIGEKFTLEDLLFQKQKLTEYSKQDNRIGEPIAIRHAMRKSEVERIISFQPDSLIIEVDDETKTLEYIAYVHRVIRPVQITFIARYTDMIVQLTAKLYPYARIYFMPYGLDNKPFSHDAILICDTESLPSENVSATLN